MAASDQLAKLVDRAKEAESRAAAAGHRAKTEVEQDVSSARASAQANADRLRETAEARRAEASDWWADVHKTWSEYADAMRRTMEKRHTEHDIDRARLRAANAEDDAQFAIDVAYSAIEEAEYAVLDATLARMDADDLSAKSGAIA
jgi:hypothetical protein